jgi:hypothetical protein
MVIQHSKTNRHNKTKSRCSRFIPTSTRNLFLKPTKSPKRKHNNKAKSTNLKHNPRPEFLFKKRQTNLPSHPLSAHSNQPTKNEQSNIKNKSQSPRTNLKNPKLRAYKAASSFPARSINFLAPWFNKQTAARFQHSNKHNQQPKSKHSQD